MLLATWVDFDALTAQSVLFTSPGNILYVRHVLDGVAAVPLAQFVKVDRLKLVYKARLY